MDKNTLAYSKNDYERCGRHGKVYWERKSDEATSEYYFHRAINNGALWMRLYSWMHHFIFKLNYKFFFFRPWHLKYYHKYVAPNWIYRMKKIQHLHLICAHCDMVGGINNFECYNIISVNATNFLLHVMIPLNFCPFSMEPPSAFLKMYELQTRKMLMITGQSI